VFIIGSMQNIESKVDRFLRWMLLALIFFLPLPFGSNIPSAWSVMVVWACALFMIWAIRWASGHADIPDGYIRAWPMHLCLLLWLFWIFMQVVPMPLSMLSILSPHAAAIQAEGMSILKPGMVIDGTISLSVDSTYAAIYKTIAYLFIFQLVLLLIRNRQHLKMLVWTLVLGGLFQAVYGSLMTLSGTEMIFFYEKKSTGVVTGTFINRNHLAGYLVMCLSLGIGLMVSMLERKHNPSWRSWIRGWLRVLMSEKLKLRLFLVIMVIALVMTRSRMGNVSFFAAMLIVGIAGLLLIHHARRSMMVLITSLIVIDIVVVGAWFGVDQVMDRLDKTFVQSSSEQGGTHVLDTDIQIGSETTALVEERGKVYRDTRQYFNDYWVTGSGLGSFRYVYPIYRSGDIQSYYEHAHRDYYEFAVETGVPGIVMLAFMMLYPLAISVSVMRHRRDPLAVGIAFGVFMSITAMLIHASVDFNLQIPANAATFIVILSIPFIVKTLSSKKRG